MGSFFDRIFQLASCHLDLPCSGLGILRQESPRSPFDEYFAPCFKCGAAFSACRHVNRENDSKFLRGSDVCASSHECGERSVGRGAKERSKHVLSPADDAGLRLVRTKAEGRQVHPRLRALCPWLDGEANDRDIAVPASLARLLAPAAHRQLDWAKSGLSGATKILALASFVKDSVADLVCSQQRDNVNRPEGLYRSVRTDSVSGSSLERVERLRNLLRESSLAYVVRCVLPLQ